MLDGRARQVQLEFLLVALPGALQAVPILTPKTGGADSAQAPKPPMSGSAGAGDLFPPVKEPIGCELCSCDTGFGLTTLLSVYLSFFEDDLHCVRRPPSLD